MQHTGRWHATTVVQCWATLSTSSSCQDTFAATEAAGGQLRLRLLQLQQLLQQPEHLVGHIVLPAGRLCQYEALCEGCWGLQGNPARDMYDDAAGLQHTQDRWPGSVSAAVWQAKAHITTHKQERDRRPHCMTKHTQQNGMLTPS